MGDLRKSVQWVERFGSKEVDTLPLLNGMTPYSLIFLCNFTVGLCMHACLCVQKKGGTVK